MLEISLDITFDASPYKLQDRFSGIPCGGWLVTKAKNLLAEEKKDERNVYTTLSPIPGFRQWVAINLKRSSTSSAFHQILGLVSVMKSLGLVYVIKSLGLVSVMKSLGLLSSMKSLGLVSVMKSLGLVSGVKSLALISIIKSLSLIHIRFSFQIKYQK